MSEQGKTYRQDRLNNEQVDALRDAEHYISKFFVWAATEEGHDYWHDVVELLGLKVKHGTSDGKPFIDPERWRVPTDEDAIGRPQCRVRDDADDEWLEAYLVAVDKSQSFPYAVKHKAAKRFEDFRYCEILDTPAE